MSGEVDFSAISGILRRRYDKKLADLRSVASVIQDRIAFEESKKVGEAYQVGVLVRPPNGFTYSGSGGGVQTLNTQRNSVSQQATVLGHELNLVERVTLKALASAVDGGEQALANLFDETVAGMKKAAMNRVEASALRGQSGYGTVESVTDLGSNSGEIVITAATWAPGIFWHFGENSLWDSFTTTTKNNGSGALVLTKITASTRTLTFTYTGTLSSECAAGDVLFPTGANAGSSSFNEPSGLIAQASNLTGTSMGIAAGTYNAWKGNTGTVTGDFNFEQLEDFFASLRDRGAAGKLTAYLNNRAYGKIASEVAAHRTIDSSYTQGKQVVGSKSISYMTAAIDEVELVRHPFLAWGEGLILPEGDIARVGASDVTLGIPGMAEDLIVLVAGSNAVEIQVFSDQAPILKKPSHAMYFTGITF